MCRYRLHLHCEVIIWRHDCHGPCLFGRESGNDVQHDAHSHIAKNYSNLAELHKHMKKKESQNAGTKMKLKIV